MSVESPVEGVHPDPLPESASRPAERRASSSRQHSLIATAVTMVGPGWLVVIPTLAGMYGDGGSTERPSHGSDVSSAGLGPG